MSTEIEGQKRHVPVLRKAAAGIVLVVAVAIVLKLALGFVIWIFELVVVVAVVAGILWALKTLVW
jgi:hypothetical protein